jgi:hypothetical protein
VSGKQSQTETTNKIAEMNLRNSTGGEGEELVMGVCRQSGRPQLLAPKFPRKSSSIDETQPCSVDLYHYLGQKVVDLVVSTRVDWKLD